MHGLPPQENDMRKYLFLAALLLMALPAFALPDHAVYTTYYDEDGNEVGGFNVFCGGGHSSWGVTTDSFVQVIGEACYVAEPLTCSDVGLSSIGSCEVNNWCVSDGYAMS